MWTPNLGDECEGKPRLTSLEQPSAPTANTSPDTTQQETKEDHDDKRRRIDEPESTVPQLLRMKFWYRALRHLIRIPEMVGSLSMFRCLRRQ